MRDPEKAALMGQLVAMRNVLDGIIATLQESDEPLPCDHPLEQRQYEAGTMGGPQSFVCGACSQTVTETAPGQGAGA